MRHQHPHKYLTDMKIRSLTVPKRYSDGNGLYLVVTQSGTKQWVLRILVHGRRRDIGLGGYKVVSLAEARAKAIEMKKLAREGIDPVTARNNARRSIPTFEQAAREVHTQNLDLWKNKKQIAQWITTLETYAFPKIGKLRVNDIRSSHIQGVLLPIWIEKHETANRVRQRMMKVLDWARANEYLETENPVRGIQEGLPRVKRRPKHFPSLAYSEISDFIKQLNTNSKSKNVNLALEFLILVACRSGELRFAKWSEINFTDSKWIIPADRIKMGVEHHIPLSDRAMDILQEAKMSWGQSEYIFPSSQNWGKAMSDGTLSAALKRLGYKITVHGFRSTFRDWASETRYYPNDVVEMALAHSNPNKTEAAYKRGNLFEKRKELMNDWAMYCASDVEPAGEGKNAKC